jgi:hypothetical protein
MTLDDATGAALRKSEIVGGADQFKLDEVISPFTSRRVVDGVGGTTARRRVCRRGPNRIAGNGRVDERKNIRRSQAADVDAEWVLVSVVAGRWSAYFRRRKKPVGSLKGNVTVFIPLLVTGATPTEVQFVSKSESLD